MGDGTQAFVGQLTTNSGRRYDLAVFLPSDYPHSLPSVHILKPRLSAAPHRYLDGQLCLCLPCEWSIEKTVVTVLGWAGHWLHNYEVYLETGTWWAREHRSG